MKRSFTLIELLVIISIMIIFIGATISQYNTFTQQSKLKNEARKLIDIFELAKKKAITADLFDKNCDNFTGYRLTLNTNNYSLIFCCNSNCSTPTNVNTYVFSSPNISIFSGTGNLNFPPLMTNTNFSISEILLRNSSINKSAKITISPIGIIELDEVLQ